MASTKNAPAPDLLAVWSNVGNNRSDPWSFKLKAISALKLDRRRCALFAAGCWRSPRLVPVMFPGTSALLTPAGVLLDPHFPAALELLENWADGKASDRDVTKRRFELSADLDPELSSHSLEVLRAACTTVRRLTRVDRVQVLSSTEFAAMAADVASVRFKFEWQGKLLVGIAGADTHLDPVLRTDTAVLIARGMYESSDFTAMPILADALQDAGFDSDVWLARMRDPTWPWCRGCRVLDLLLDK